MNNRYCKTLARTLATVLALTLLFTRSPALGGATVDPATGAINFLLQQQDPTTYLLDSFSADAEENPGSGGRIAFLFDLALALIALSHAGIGNPVAAEAARMLATALIAMQIVLSPRGAPEQGYWPASFDHSTGQAIHQTIEAGPNAWMGYALLFYAATLEAPDAEDAKRAAERYANYAIGVLRNTPHYDYGFGPDLLFILSSEINLDTYWLFFSLGAQHSHFDPSTGQEQTMDWWAKRLYAELMGPQRNYWNPVQGRLNRGDGDEFISEDPLTWGSMIDSFATGGARQISPLLFALDPANGLLVTLADYETPFCGTRTLIGLEDNVDPISPGPCTETIWLEATAHMACALYYAGLADDAAPFLDTLLCTGQETEDARGWPHSLKSVVDSCGGSHFGPEFGLHVGATAWAYFALQTSQGDRLPYRPTFSQPLAAKYWERY